MDKKKIKIKSLPVSKKPDTATRAGITANLKFTRGKQLVEHSPFNLIPDPFNPRPGELIDENWLKNYLGIGTDSNLCYIDNSGEYLIPEFRELSCDFSERLEESYNFLRDLALSIRFEGLIEPIEIFLADRNNDPDYFNNINLDYGYVILEGHQRRLAAMMANVPTVTCIEITDESMLVKLKIKHRKLRRQLSENNLRKGLTVSQNFLILRELLTDVNSESLTNKELSGIIGLNEAIVSSLKTICTSPDKFPSLFISMIIEDKLTFKKIRYLVPKSYNDIIDFLNGKNTNSISENKIKSRGKKGGAVKKIATFKVRDTVESNSLKRLLLSRFPELPRDEFDDSCFKTLEKLLNKIKEIAINELV